MLILVVNILLAALPSTLLLIWFWKLDRQKPEPAGLVLKLFFWGCLSIIPAVVAELFMGLFKPFFPRYLWLIYDAFIVAALCEESVKLLTTRLFAWGKAPFDEIMDGIVYTVAAGLGFAFLENIFYSLGSSSFAMILLIRGVTAVPLHALCSAYIGYFLGKARFDRKTSILPGLLLAILFHGLYDWFLFMGKWETALLILPLLIIGYIGISFLIRRAKLLDREAGRS